MSSRVNFFVFVEDSSGNALFKKDIDPASELTFTKDGGGYSPTKINNGDGSYYFTITESGKYTILINGNAQAEFTDVYIAAEDNLSQQNLEGSPSKGQVKLNGSSNLEIEDAATMLLAAQVINDLTTGGTTVPLSAEQGKALKTLVDLRTTIASIVNDVTTGGVAVPLSAEMGKDIATLIALSFANPNYISDDFNISQNFERLDGVLNALALSTNNQITRQVWAAVLEAAVTDDAEIGSAKEWTENTQAAAKVKIQVPFVKKPTDTTAIFRCTAKTTGVGGSDFGYFYLKDVDSSEYATVTVLAAETSMTEKTVELDISGLSNGLRYLNIEMGINGSAGSMQMSYPVIEVQQG